MNRPIVFFDLETGGLERKHPVIQMAAIVVRDWKELLWFERKIQFREADCDPEALEMNSYDPDLWKAEALPGHQAVRDFIREVVEPYRWMPAKSKRGKTWLNAVMAGHNTRFDRDRIGWLCQDVREFLAVDFRGLDTMQLALWTLHQGPGELPKDFKLGTLCEFFGISTEGAHDALTDVRLSIELAKRCLEKTPFG